MLIRIGYAHQVMLTSSPRTGVELCQQCASTVAPAPDWLRAELAGRRAYGGLDLAAKQDTTAWSLLVPDGLDGVPSML
jgi:phage terminase large subunit-like protein